MDAIHNAKMKEICLGCQRPYSEHSIPLNCPTWTRKDGTERCYTFKDETFIPSGKYDETE